MPLEIPLPTPLFDFFAPDERDVLNFVAAAPDFTFSMTPSFSPAPANDDDLILLNGDFEESYPEPFLVPLAIVLSFPVTDEGD